MERKRVMKFNGFVLVVTIGVVFGPLLWFMLGYFTIFGAMPDVDLLLRVMTGWICVLLLAFLSFLLS